LLSPQLSTTTTTTTASLRQNTPPPTNTCFPSQDPSDDIRLTLTSRKKVQIRLTAEEIVEHFKKRGVAVQGPTPMPTQHLRISSRKTPNGEGSKTWNNFEMSIHKRIIE